MTLVRLIFIGLFAFSLVFSAYAVDKQNIVAYWSCDEGRGEKVMSAVGGYIGTLMVGSGWKGNPHQEGWGEGRFGKGLAFDEKKEWFVLIKTNDNLDKLGKPNSAFTVSYWIKSAKTSGKGRTVDKGSSGWTQGWHCALVSGKAFMEVCDDKAPGAAIPGNQIVADDKWHHIAHIFEVGKEGRIYIDGNLDARGNIAGDPDIAGVGWDLTFGTVGFIENPWHEFLSGYMDEIALFDKALSEAEIRELATGPVMLPPTAVKVKDKITTTWAGIKR